MGEPAQGTVELLAEVPSSGPCADQWRQLAIARENIFATPEWCRSWFATEPAEKPTIVVWRDESGAVRGVVPLARTGTKRVLRPVGAPFADWFAPVCAPADEREFGERCAAALAAADETWTRLSLDWVLADSQWPAALVERWPAPGAAAIARRRVQPLPYASLEGGFDGYLAGRSRNFRSQLGRRRRKLERDHGLRFRRTAAPEEIGPDFDVFARLHRARWANRGGGALSPTSEGLHRMFAVEALRADWLRLWIMELDGEPAAAWYGWRIGKRYLYYLSGFEPRYEQLGVGTVLLAHTIAAAAEEGATTYDMLAGDESYKRRFETGRRETASYVVARRLTPSWARALAALPTEALARDALRLLRRQ